MNNVRFIWGIACFAVAIVIFEAIFETPTVPGILFWIFFGMALESLIRGISGRAAYLAMKKHEKEFHQDQDKD